MKDVAHAALARASNAAAISPITRALWVATIGRRTLDAVTGAGTMFIHIPKTGGTSICACLYGRNLPHYTRSFYAAAYGDRVVTLPSFSLVRDPVARLHSAYRFMRAGGTDLVTTSRLDLARLPAWDSFAAFVTHLVQHPATINRFSLLRPQADFIVDETGRIQVDRVFLLNESDGTMPDLARYLKIARLPHLNVSPGSVTAIPADLRAAITTLYAADAHLVEQVRRHSGMLSSVDWVAKRRTRSARASAFA